MSSFTPAQKDLYDALMNANRTHVVIAREVARALQNGDPLAGKGWGDFGAPVEAPEWIALERAMKHFGDTIGGGDLAAAKAAVPVLDAVLRTTWR